MFKIKKICIVFLIFILQSCGILNIWKNRNHQIRKSYYEDGSIEYESSYFNEKLDGATYYYDNKGLLQTYSEYENGSLHGISKKFYKSGNILYECNYFYGHKHGEEKFYHENGQIQSLIEYNYGNEIKKIIRWNEKGELLY